MANSVKEIMDVYVLVKDKADKVVNKNDEKLSMFLADYAKYTADIYIERMKADYENGKKSKKDENQILSDIKTQCLMAKIEGKILKLKYKIFGEKCLRFNLNNLRIDVMKNRINI